MKSSAIWKMPEEEFRAVIKKSSTYTEILSHFGLLNRGSNHKTLKKRINFLGLSFVSKPNTIKQNRSKPLKDLLIKGYRFGNHNLKKRLIEEGLLKEKCSESGCQVGNTWNGKKISLHLDHKNGDSSDYRLFNLRFLCPNCHSQTYNYCGKARKLPQKICSECGQPIKKNLHGYCLKCYNKKRTKNPPCKKEELEQLIQQIPVTKIAFKFGVSDSAVKKWMSKYGLKKIYGRGEWGQMYNTPIPSKKELKNYAQTLSLKKIGEIYGVGEYLIRKWCDFYNISRPNSSYWAKKRWDTHKRY
jgi:transposase-like protein